MKKQKVGLVLFWIAVVWAILWGVIGSVLVDTALRDSTMEEVNQTMLAMGGSWMTIWAFSVPLAAVIAAIGMLIYSGAKGSTIWTVSIRLFAGLALGILLMGKAHIPVLFGIGGTLILLFFLGIIWLWAKERIHLKGAAIVGADCKLVAYVFFLLSAWYTCGMASMQFMKVFADKDPISPLYIMIFIVLGWLFLFLGHYYSHKQAKEDAT